MMKSKARITAIGTYVPPKKLLNFLSHEKLN